MRQHDSPARNPLELGHLDVVALEGLDHRRPHHAEDVGDDDDDQRRDRQHEQ